MEKEKLSLKENNGGYKSFREINRIIINGNRKKGGEVDKSTVNIIAIELNDLIDMYKNRSGILIHMLKYDRMHNIMDFLNLNMDIIDRELYDSIKNNIKNLQEIISNSESIATLKVGDRYKSFREVNKIINSINGLEIALNENSMIDLLSQTINLYANLDHNSESIYHAYKGDRAYNLKQFFSKYEHLINKYEHLKEGVSKICANRFYKNSLERYNYDTSKERYQYQRIRLTECEGKNKFVRENGEDASYRQIRYNIRLFGDIKIKLEEEVFVKYLKVILGLANDPESAHHVLKRGGSYNIARFILDNKNIVKKHPELQKSVYTLFGKEQFQNAVKRCKFGNPNELLKECLNLQKENLEQVNNHFGSSIENYR